MSTNDGKRIRCFNSVKQCVIEARKGPSDFLVQGFSALRFVENNECDQESISDS